jgi:formylglycine-generating enzyme required for sulfatase activity
MRVVWLLGIVIASPQPSPAPRCPADMASIPGGRVEIEETRRTTTVAPFCLDKTEVTVAAYAACVRKGACGSERLGDNLMHYNDGGRLEPDSMCNWDKPGRANHPINCVDWAQAAAYCRAQGKRLPTEEEWQQGAAQNRFAAFPWGNEDPDGRVCKNVGARRGTCAVGGFPGGDAPGGVHDLAGNVAEWTAHEDRRAIHPRVVRGGGWYGDGQDFLIAHRSTVDDDTRLSGVGFRCAR